MYKLLTLAVALATPALGKGILVEQKGIDVTAYPDHTIEVAVTDDTLDSNGLLLAASIDVKVELVGGQAVVNDQYALPVGLTHISLKADVKNYVLGVNNERNCHKTFHAIDVGLVARVVRDEASSTTHMTFQLTEYDGVTKEVEHTTIVSVTVDEVDKEVKRLVNPKSEPLSAAEKQEAVNHHVSGFLDDSETAAEEDFNKALHWFKTSYGKVTIVFLGLLVFLGLVGLISSCCCRTRQTRQSSKGANYKKNLSMKPVSIFSPSADKYKGVKYTILAGGP